MATSVLLRHDLPDGSWHYDWMIERPGDAARGLVTFRTGMRVDEVVGGFEVERLTDHRRAYLEYEGKVTGGRGTVRRVAEGRVVAWVEEGEQVRVVVEFGGVARRFVGKVVGDDGSLGHGLGAGSLGTSGAGGRWRFVVETGEGG